MSADLRLRALALADWLDFSASLRRTSVDFSAAGPTDYPLDVARAVLRLERDHG